LAAKFLTSDKSIKTHFSTKRCRS